MESGTFSINSIVIDPDVSPLGAPVKIMMEWVSPCELSGAVWKVFYQVDTIRKRRLLELVSLGPENFLSGVNTLAVEIPSIDVDASQNITAGILVMSLARDQEELLGINMIVQVMVKDGVVYKTIFSPLE